MPIYVSSLNRDFIIIIIIIIIIEMYQQIQLPPNPWNILGDMNLVQHVSDATHIAGHTLDQIITRNFDIAVLSDTVNVSSLLTDHHTVEFRMRLSKPDSVKQVIQYRSLQKINHNELGCDTRQLSVVTHPDDSLLALVNQFNSDLSKLPDKHAPLTSRSLPIRPFFPWNNDELIAAKQERRRRESQ